jgi:OPA family sugar phosphate sensor protein UhpC-like MFS transporter
MLAFLRAGVDSVALQKTDVDALFRRKRFNVMTAITLGYGLYYTCRLVLSVVKKPLIDGGVFNANELGQLGAWMLGAYGFGKFFNGFLADHANVKWFLPTGLFVSALINIALGGTDLFWVWAGLFVLNGWFQGFGASGSVVAISSWFSNNERGRYYGIWSAAHAIGEGLTFVVTASLVTYGGWRMGFVGPGVLCAISAGFLVLALEDRPQTLGLPSVAEWRNDHPPVKAAQGTTRQLQWLVVTHPAIWVLGLSSAAMYVTRYGINSWGILYLQEMKGYSLIQAGAILGANTVAGIAGSVAYGFISDLWFKASRPPANLLFGVLEIVSLGIFFFAPPGHPYLVTAAVSVYGFALSGILASLGGLFAVDIAPKRATGAAMGFIGGFSYLGAAVQELIAGRMIHQGSTMLDGKAHYDFGPVILFWMGGSVLSLLLATSLWRVKPTE